MEKEHHHQRQAPAPARAAKQAPSITPEELRRSILESAYKGQEQSKTAQAELERQGEKLKTSLDQAKVVAEQTDTTKEAVDDLISEAKASKLRKVLRCCLDTCGFCWCCRASGAKRIKSRGPSQPGTISPDIEDSENENETLIRLESLKSVLSGEKDGRAATSWKRTLAPPPGVLNSGTEIWYRQVDASLTQLQHVADDMSQSLDEQIKLAQMLTIYLNYGVDQVIGANERLGAEKALF